MIRVFLAFAVIMGLFHFGIQAWQHATGKQRWTAVKSLTYSLFLAIITLVLLIAIVIIF